VTFRKTLEITKDVHEEQKEDVPSFVETVEIQKELPKEEEKPSFVETVECSTSVTSGMVSLSFVISMVSLYFSVEVISSGISSWSAIISTVSLNVVLISSGGNFQIIIGQPETKLSVKEETEEYMEEHDIPVPSEETIVIERETIQYFSVEVISSGISSWSAIISTVSLNVVLISSGGIPMSI
jgi:hypothetical protein